MTGYIMNEMRRRGSQGDKCQPSPGGGLDVHQKNKRLDYTKDNHIDIRSGEIADERLGFGDSLQLVKKSGDRSLIERTKEGKESYDERGLLATGKSKTGSMHIQNFNFFIKSTNSNTRREEPSPGVLPVKLDMGCWRKRKDWS